MEQLLCKKDGSLTNVGQNVLVAWPPVAQYKCEIEFEAISDTQERCDGDESEIKVDDDDDGEKDGDEADYDYNEHNFNTMGWLKIKMTTTTTTTMMMMMMTMKRRRMKVIVMMKSETFFCCCYFVQDSKRYWSSRELWNSSNKNNICRGFRWRCLR